MDRIDLYGVRQILPITKLSSAYTSHISRKIGSYFMVYEFLRLELSCLTAYLERIRLIRT
jgi:hypothetical protein